MAEGIPKWYWDQMLVGAKERGFQVDITPEKAAKLLVEQKWLCKLSGIPIEFHGAVGWRTHTASLDRIDSSRGYVVGNVQWVHKIVNLMKWDKSDGELIRLCCLVHDHRFAA